MIQETAMTFNVLIKEEEGIFIAHCLELDLVTTATSLDQVQTDILDVIGVQVDYAFTNNNLEYLYHPAPQEVWKEFFECQEQWEKKHKITPPSKGETASNIFVPTWIIAKTCKRTSHYHV
ncbi:MAG: hypothetical protein HY879_19325 [Deltaproteobacteria bacterium]|nr:hypothetical protein [Deltaproteobacteria bacterium]